jgi:branched-chain amino acid transport system permease protein
VTAPHDLFAAGRLGLPRDGARAWLTWLVAAGVLILLPSIFRADSAVAVMCIIGVSMVFALSYNMLLGQTGLLSFGHAIFFGLGGFCAIHAMNKIAAAHAPVPLLAVPLIGGLGGLCFGIVFGSLASKRGGTIFAMISFGLGELVSSAAPILNNFFGGEAGITTDRSALYAPFGVNFGPQIQVYYLIAGWCLVAAAAMHFVTRTPFGQIMRAARENPERLEFIGCSARKVRFTAFVLAAFFAGVAGALAAVNFEIMTVSNVGGNQSAMVVLMTYIGGIGFFAGPIIGAMLITLMQVMLSDITAGWQMYLGILFVLVVMYAPGGLAALFGRQASGLRGWGASRHVLLLVPMLLAAFGGIILIELGYQAGLKSSEGPVRVLFGVPVSAWSPAPWLFASALIVAGMFGLRFVNGSADKPSAMFREQTELPHG